MGLRNTEYNPKVKRPPRMPTHHTTPHSGAAFLRYTDGWCALALSSPCAAPQRFSAVIMRIRKPKATALIFSSGKVFSPSFLFLSSFSSLVSSRSARIYFLLRLHNSPSTECHGIWFAGGVRGIKKREGRQEGLQKVPQMYSGTHAVFLTLQLHDPIRILFFACGRFFACCSK